MFYRILFALSVVALGAVSGRAQSSSAGDAYWPGSNSWEEVRAEDAGADPQQLKEALDFAGTRNSKGVVVLWRGRILAERYWDGWTEETTHAAYSASKSVVSTLVGMAIEEGKIDGTDQSADDFLSEWKGSTKHEAITVGNLLSMTSGLQGGKRNFLKGTLSRDERAFATALPVEFTPGTHWDYHNSAYRLLFPILQEATGQSLESYTKTKLLDPLGMKRTKWATKRLARDQYTFLTTSPRDAARFGLLILRKGRWNGKQLISRAWIERATSPIDPRVNPSYGYLWWLNGGDQHFMPLNPEKQAGPIFPGCPADTFAALGKDDQKIYIVPSLDLVVTRLGDAADSETPAISRFDAEFLGRICRSFSVRVPPRPVSGDEHDQAAAAAIGTGDAQPAPEHCPACAMGLTAEFVFKRLDADQDKLVTVTEFMRSPGMQDEVKAREVVARLDKGGDGKLSWEELESAYQARHAHCKKPDPATLAANAERAGSDGRGDGNRFAQVFILRSDQNGDGKISRDEFRGPGFGFDRLDKNKNGFIEANELGELHQRRLSDPKSMRERIESGDVPKPPQDKLPKGLGDSD